MEIVGIGGTLYKKYTLALNSKSSGASQLSVNETLYWYPADKVMITGCQFGLVANNGSSVLNGKLKLSIKKNNNTELFRTQPVIVGSKTTFVNSYTNKTNITTGVLNATNVANVTGGNYFVTTISHNGTYGSGKHPYGISVNIHYITLVDF